MRYTALLIAFAFICGCAGFNQAPPVTWQVLHKNSGNNCPDITGSYQASGKVMTSYPSQSGDIHFAAIWYDVIRNPPFDAKTFSITGTVASDFAIEVNESKLNTPNILNELSKYPNKKTQCKNGAMILSINRSFTGMHSGKIDEFRDFYFFPTADGSLAVLKKSTFKSSFENDDVREKWSLFHKVK